MSGSRIAGHTLKKLVSLDGNVFRYQTHYNQIVDLLNRSGFKGCPPSLLGAYRKAIIDTSNRDKECDRYLEYTYLTYGGGPDYLPPHFDKAIKTATVLMEEHAKEMAKCSGVPIPTFDSDK